MLYKEEIDCKKAPDLEFLEIERLFALTTVHPDQTAVDEITREEMLVEQQTDDRCKELRETARNASSHLYENNEYGILVRYTGTEKQVILPESLRQRAMTLVHRPLCAAHPGSRKMYATLRKTYF